MPPVAFPFGRNKFLQLQMSYLTLYVVLSALFISLALSQRECSFGEFRDGMKCKECPKNTFSDSGNATRCKPCDPFRESEIGSSSCSLCPIGTFVRPGKPNRCKFCPTNTFSSTQNSTECTSCPPGEVGPFRSNRCGTCRLGFRVVVFKRFVICRRCPPGSTTSVENAITCDQCPPGTFRSFRDFHRGGTGLCKMCAPGSFADEPGSVICKRCPQGTFQNEMGVAECKPCPAGSETRSTGSMQCRATCDRKDPSCISCRAGTGYNSKTKKCEACPPGFIGQIRSSTPCFRCPLPDGVANEKRTKCTCPDGSRIPKKGIC